MDKHPGTGGDPARMVGRERGVARALEFRSNEWIGDFILSLIYQASPHTTAGEKGNPAQGHVCLQFVAQGLA